MTRCLRPSHALFVVYLAACSGPAEDADAGTDAAVADAGTLEDAGTDAGGCAERVMATIGPEGGEVVHCAGARLVVPAGALAEPTELAIERVTGVPDPFAPYVLAGDAFRFEPMTPALADSVEVVLPHDGGARMEMAVVVDDAWLVIEACNVTETTISQTFHALGTFVALRDPTPYPDSVTGVGEGTIAYTFGDVTDTLDADPHGYAIDSDPGEARSLTLLYRRSDDTGLVQVDVRFTIAADGLVEPLQIQRADTSVSEIWSADVIATPDDLTITITSDVGGAIEGTIDATLHLGEMTRPFSATFSATPGLFRFPPELVCEDLPKG